MCEGAPEGKDIDDEFEECEDDSPAGCAAQVTNNFKELMPLYVNAPYTIINRLVTRVLSIVCYTG